jgi:hypothetical protein
LRDLQRAHAIESGQALPERLDRVALGIDREAFDDAYTGQYGRQAGRQPFGTALPPSMYFDRHLSSTGIFLFSAQA